MEELSISVLKRIKLRVVLKRVWSPYVGFSSLQMIARDAGRSAPDRTALNLCNTRGRRERLQYRLATREADGPRPAH